MWRNGATCCLNENAPTLAANIARYLCEEAQKTFSFAQYIYYYDTDPAFALYRKPKPTERSIPQ